MGGWKRGSDTDPQMAKWGNLFFLISLSITIWGVKAFPVLWILSLLMTPLLGVFFLMNLGYGLPKILDYIVLWIFTKSGLLKLIKYFLSWVEKQIKKLIKRFKNKNK
tara:strand:- start:101 stop:421 length:321 start_codon:yes stop_codon:yes gene_type:complete